MSFWPNRLISYEELTGTPSMKKTNYGNKKKVNAKKNESKIQKKKKSQWEPNLGLKLTEPDHILNLCSNFKALCLQKLGTACGEWTSWFKPVSFSSVGSFFRRISMTFRWWFECSSLENVGLQAGLYSGSNRPDLNRTPHALHSVLAPIGPALHCGVFWTPQWLHRRGGCCCCRSWQLKTDSADRFLCFLGTGGFSDEATGSSSSAPENHGLEGPEEEEEEVEHEDDEDDEPSDQSLTPFRFRLLRALAGTGDLKHDSSVAGITGCFRSPVNHAGFSTGVPVRFGAEYSVKESSTKWDSHSRFAKSSAFTQKYK